MAKFRDDRDPVPERLARFVLSEWAGDMQASTAAWGAACRRWLADHPGRVLPFAEDPVEVRQEVIRVRMSARRPKMVANGDGE